MAARLLISGILYYAGVPARVKVLAAEAGGGSQIAPDKTGLARGQQ